MLRRLGIQIAVLFSFLQAACGPSAGSEPLPNAPVPLSVAALNLIAVGIAVVGGILGLILASRRRGGSGEPHAKPTRSEPPRKKRP